LILVSSFRLDQNNLRLNEIVVALQTSMCDVE